MKPIMIGMLCLICTLVMIFIGLCECIHPPDQYVYGKLCIDARDIYADVYIRGYDQDCGCTPSLWNGGTVTVGADLSSVQVGDMADLRGLDGEHLVLECISITGVPSWLLETDGDVLVVNGRLVYRLTRL